MAEMAFDIIWMCKHNLASPFLDSHTTLLLRLSNPLVPFHEESIYQIEKCTKGKNTSNCRNVSSRLICLRWRDFNWFCSSENSKSIIDSQSSIAASLSPSCSNRDRSFSVETTMSSEGAKSLLVSTLGKRSLAANNASIHTVLSSLDTHRKWRVLVPVNMESLLSSDLLARIEETCRTHFI